MPRMALILSSVPCSPHKFSQSDFSLSGQELPSLQHCPCCAPWLDPRFLCPFLCLPSRLPPQRSQARQSLATVLPLNFARQSEYKSTCTWDLRRSPVNNEKSPTREPFLMKLDTKVPSFRGGSSHFQHGCRSLYYCVSFHENAGEASCLILSNVEWNGGYVGDMEGGILTHWGARAHSIVLLQLTTDDFTGQGDESYPLMSLT